MRAGAPRLLIALALFVAGTPQLARAQVCSNTENASRRLDWAPLLSRPISLHATDITIKAALDRVAASAGIRLSYSADLLPKGARVCATWDGVAAGDALIELVGRLLEPVVAGADLVVLTPRPDRDGPAPVPVEPSVVSLEPLVVTANTSAPARQSRSFVQDVIDGRELSRQSATSLATALNSAVPGVWLWSSPSTGVAQYGSLRGASSFGLNAPKVYIDGIEVANPLLLTRLAPDAIDRIEVIRGPQGSAMYGADALGGVTNIITRNGANAAGAPRAQLNAGFGLGTSQFNAGGAVEQNHSIGLAAGSAAKSASLNLALGRMGAFVPGAFSDHVSANASGRRVGASSIVTGTLRLFAQQAGQPGSPLLDSLTLSKTPAAGVTAAADALSLRQYTLGVNAVFTGSPRWRHTLVAGFDGYTLDGVSDIRSAWQTPADSALRAAGSNAIRGTLRMSSAAHMIETDRADATVTMTAEHSVLRQRGGFEIVRDPVNAPAEGRSRAGMPARGVLEWNNGTVVEEALLQRTNTGLGAQIDASVDDRLFLTGGVRIERDGGAALASRIAALPTVGGAFVTDAGPVSLKLRAAYGKGIRWPQLPTQLGAGGLHSAAMRLDLAPEEQSGIEAGFDLGIGRALAVRVTRFDQTATGLIQQVGMADTSRWHAAGYSLENLRNLGEISNRGWELQATVRRGPMSLASALSFVDSRVAGNAGDYTGDLHTGDRVLAVPAKTMSLTAAWSSRVWSASMTAYRAADWINYDRIALARALSTEPGSVNGGLQLRDYWREYEGNTHLRAVFSRDLRRGMTLMLTGDNLLNLQVGEPDNVTIVPGRSISIGLRAAF